MSAGFIKNVGISFSVHSKSLTSGLNKVNTKLKRSKKHFRSAEKNAKQFAKVMAGAVVAGVALAVKSFNNMEQAINRADTLKKNADNAEISAEKYQLYAIAAQRAGIATVSFDAGMKAFNVKLSKFKNNFGTMAEYMKKNPIFETLHNDLKGMNNDQALERITQELESITNEADRTQLMLGLFGDSGSKFRKMFEGLAQAKEDLAKNPEWIISTEELVRIESVRDEVDDIRRMSESLEIRMAAENIDGFRDAARASESMKLSMMQIGQDILPVVASVMSKISKVADYITDDSGSGFFSISYRKTMLESLYDYEKIIFRMEQLRNTMVPGFLETDVSGNRASLDDIRQQLKDLEEDEANVAAKKSQRAMDEQAFYEQIGEAKKKNIELTKKETVVSGEYSTTTAKAHTDIYAAIKREIEALENAANPQLEYERRLDQINNALLDSAINHEQATLAINDAGAALNKALEPPKQKGDGSAWEDSRLKVLSEQVNTFVTQLWEGNTEWDKFFTNMAKSVAAQQVSEAITGMFKKMVTGAKKGNNDLQAEMSKTQEIAKGGGGGGGFGWQSALIGAGIGLVGGYLANKNSTGNSGASTNVNITVEHNVHNNSSNVHAQSESREDNSGGIKKIIIDTWISDFNNGGPTRSAIRG